ncbi:MAG: DinB family protein [Candidatus Thorarchaeota archaeon]
MREILIKAFKRHIKETLPLIEQLTEVNIMSKPCPECKEIGEVILHMVRSTEFYMNGITTNQWKSLNYSLDQYDSAEAIIDLATDVFKRLEVYTRMISIGDLGRTVKPFDRSATIGELLLEMIEHSIHHRGQLTVYYRFLGIKPKSISYII